MKYLLLLLLAGCGGTYKVKTSGSSTVEHKITIDFSVCDQLPEENDRVECIKVLLEILRQAREKENKEVEL